MNLAQRGTSLFEMMLVIVVLGIVVSLGIPRAARALEEARVDAAAASLRSMWHAQRLYRLEAGAYASDTASLSDMRLIEPAIFATRDPFEYSLVNALEDSYDFEAVRMDSSVWSGTLSIDELGVLTGSVQDGGGDAITPVTD